MRLGILHSTIRAEEKLLIEAARSRNVEVQLFDIRTWNMNPATWAAEIDIALERSVSTVKGTYAVEFLESMNVYVVNTAAVAAVCEDKYRTSLALQRNGIPTPSFSMVFSETQARLAVEELGGYPVVLKPSSGSWGRLLAKINDDDALEALLEHKDVLGSPQQKAFYLQEYMQKPGRDIRAFVIGGETICAIYRDSTHWITNTARGGLASNCSVSPELADICRRSSEAVGGGILAMDVFETDEGYSINEINHTMEFRNSEKPTGVSISGAMIDYCIEIYQNRSHE